MEGGGGGGNVSTTKSISGETDNHENLINQVCGKKQNYFNATKCFLLSSETAQNCLANSIRSQLSVNCFGV